mgnify:CR=1 FL=1
MDKPNEINVLTKECILTALLRLMEEKPYDSISITDITSLAGVSRMAYYRNYSSKEEILLRHLEDEEKKIIESSTGAEDTTIKDIIFCVSDFIQNNSSVIKAVYSAGLTHRLTDMLNKRIYSYFPVSNQTTVGKYAVRFYVGAILSVYRYWIDNGMEEPADTVSEIIWKLINQDSAIEYLVYPEN